MCMGQLSSVIYQQPGVAVCEKRECMGIEPTGSFVHSPLVLKTNTESTQAASNEDHTENTASVLERPFVHYLTTNLPSRAREHFFGLREAKSDLVGFALFDRIDKPLATGTALTESMWQKREIENYLCRESVLLAYARHDQPDDLFGRAEAERREQVMRECIQEVTAALQTLGRPAPWSVDVKASDEFLNPLFDLFFRKLGLPNLLRKTDYYVLADLVPANEIDPEVVAKLDGIVAVAAMAKPKEG